ncbi:MAG: amidohydrolase [Ruminococcaceae bacterium]|nr:amidohydrolase [Oscillospiraceae bacterium]
MKIIINAHIISMDGPDYENGYIKIDGKTIHSLGNMDDINIQPDDYDAIYDVEGAMALPGFIDAHCHVGLWEEGAGAEGDDGNEDSDPITPQLRAIDAINPFDLAFSEALSAGVTTAVTGPGSANVIGGQFAAVKTAGSYVDEMVIKAPVAMKAALGENPKSVYGGKKQAPSTRMATASLLREALFEAKEYVSRMDEYEKNKDGDRPEPDFKMEALAPVIRGELPLKIHAHRADDIATAIRIGEEFGVKFSLEHCTEGHLILPLLAKKNLPVMLGPTLGGRTKPELKNLSFAIYKAFEDAGIPFAIITDHPEIPLSRLYLCASLACQSGLSPKTALAAITINAAVNIGLDKQIGSLTQGKDADIVIHDGELFSLDAKIKAVFVNGMQKV